MRAAHAEPPGRAGGGGRRRRGGGGGRGVRARGPRRGRGPGAARRADGRGAGVVRRPRPARPGGGGGAGGPGAGGAGPRAHRRVRQHPGPEPHRQGHRRHGRRDAHRRLHAQPGGGGPLRRPGAGAGARRPASGATGTTWPTSSRSASTSTAGGGRRYALPLDFGSQAVYYSTALWDAAGLTRPPYDWTARGWTTEEFLDAARRLARLPVGPGGEAVDGERERPAGSGGGTGAGVWGWHQGTGLRQWAPWVWSFGGDVLDKQGTKCVLDQAPAVEGLQFLQDLIHKHRVMPPPLGPGGHRRGDGQRPAGDGAGHPVPRGALPPGPGAGLRRGADAAAGDAADQRRRPRVAHGGEHAPRQRGVGAPAVARLQGGADAGCASWAAPRPRARA